MGLLGRPQEAVYLKGRAQYLEHHGTRTARKWLHLTYNTEVIYTLGKSTKDPVSKSNDQTLQHKITK